MSKTLIISPHPDDETLGCGGTILKLKAKGNVLHWMIVTGMLENEGYDAARICARRKEIDAVAGEYRFDDVFQLGFPATKLDLVPRGQLIEAVGKVIGKVKPEIVYLPNESDVHSDHKIVFDAAISASKTFRCPFLKKVLMYETVSETEFAPALQAHYFVPNSFSDISDYLERKIAVMELYKGELGEHPFPRSAENTRALATFRGATAGVKYAESFMLLKEIW